MDEIRLNVALLRRKVPNLTTAAKSMGIRPATVSNLCTGKIDLGKAEVRTLVGLASLANCTVDELIIRGEKLNMIETKIKTLDFFAPLVKEGMTGLIARPGMGQVVILAELMHRFKKSNYTTVFLLPTTEYSVLEGTIELADYKTKSIEETFKSLSSISGDIIFITDKSYIVSGELLDLQEKLVAENINNITTILLDLSGEVVDEEMPYGPLETVWQLDVDLATRHLYPAVHPLYSTSSIIEGVDLDQRHFNLRQRAQKLLRRYRELRSIVTVHGKDKIRDTDLETYERGTRLEAYFTQPFFVAEEVTGQEGKEVTMEQTLKDVEYILEGKADDLSIKELMFKGSLV
ncbi:ATP synthase subunit B [Bacillus sp. FJAT-22090]|uniref:ATP synthase beta subunit C-terminal domain-containing protein n=1 Tax=Bacillus sp. FJAT-22090 TaxID=1581038 RepID=UPI0006AE19BA|nr:ATP synthase subunit B [Bacillus sp. FJAT-22090]ALC87466.1 ATP synthase subunit B [Bacillus sp. FJAT-22090]